MISTKHTLLPKRHITLIFISAILLFPSKLLAQAPSKVDSSYIEPFSGKDFAARTYFVNKFTGFDLRSKTDEIEDITLSTNNPVNIGVGVGWKGFFLNFSYGFDFFRDKKKGDTSRKEFQHHGYGRTFVYDIQIQEHKGFYKKSGANRILSSMKLTTYGGAFQYIFNNKKFSYPAAFNQNEKQLKSAGSFLAGANLYYNKIRTDSVPIFEGVKPSYENLQIGITAGYAYTWVFHPKWFLTGSAATGISMGNDDPGSFFSEKMQFYPITDFRLAGGYHLENWSIGISSQYNKVYLFYDKNGSFSTLNGSVTLSAIYRFDIGNPKLHKSLNDTFGKIDKIKKDLGL